MKEARNKKAEIITQTHKTPLEQADEILSLFSKEPTIDDVFQEQVETRCPNCNKTLSFVEEAEAKCDRCDWAL